MEIENGEKIVRNCYFSPLFLCFTSRIGVKRVYLSPKGTCQALRRWLPFGGADR